MNNRIRALIAVGVASFVAAAVIQGWRYEAKLSKQALEHAQAWEDHSKSTIESIERIRKREQEISQIHAEQANQANDKYENEKIESDSLRSINSGLLKRQNELVRATTSKHPELAKGGKAGKNSLDLLAYMLEKLSERAITLAGIADRARIAGTTCESMYDTLADTVNRK